MFKVTSTSNMKDGINFGGMSKVHLDEKNRKTIDHKNKFIDKKLTDLNRNKVYISNEEINKFYQSEIHNYNLKQIKNRHKEKVVNEKDTDDYLKQFRMDKRRHNVGGVTFNKSVVFQFGNTQTMFGEYDNEGSRLSEMVQNTNMRSFFENKGISFKDFSEVLNKSFLEYADGFNHEHIGLKLGQVFTNMDEGYPHMHALVWITGKNRYNNLDPTFINAFKSELSQEEMIIVRERAQGNRKKVPSEIAKLWHEKDDKKRYRIFEKNLTEFAESHGINDFSMELSRPSKYGMTTGIELEEYKKAKARVRKAEIATKQIKQTIVEQIKEINPEHVVDSKKKSNTDIPSTKILDEPHQPVNTKKGFLQHLVMDIDYLTDSLNLSYNKFLKSKLVKILGKIGTDITVTVRGQEIPLTDKRAQTQMRSHFSTSELVDSVSKIADYIKEKNSKKEMELSNWEKKIDEKDRDTTLSLIRVGDWDYKLTKRQKSFDNEKKAIGKCASVILKVFESVGLPTEEATKMIMTGVAVHSGRQFDTAELFLNTIQEPSFIKSIRKINKKTIKNNNFFSNSKQTSNFSQSNDNKRRNRGFDMEL